MKKIMLATDASSAATHAAEFLAHLPHDETLELVVVSALYVPGSERTYLVGDWIETCLAQERKNADRAFAHIQKVFAGANVKLVHVVREGHPGETIVNMACELKPELLGVQSHSDDIFC